MAYAAAKKYPFIKNWIGPNEPECRFEVLQKNKPEEYAKILLALYKGIKDGNPTATVYPLGGQSNMSPTRGIRNSGHILEACRKFAPDVTFDGNVIHTYRPFPESPDTDKDTEFFIDVLKKIGYGENTPIDWNEGGYFYPLTVPQWMGIAPWQNTTTKDKYSYMILPTYDMGWAERVGTAMLLRYWLVAAKYSDRIKSATTWTPLLIDNRTPFSRVAMQTAFLDILGDSNFVKDVRFTLGQRAYVFEDDNGRAVAAVWYFKESFDRGKENTPTMSVDLSGIDAEIIDMMGNVCTVDKQGDNYRLPLSNFPFYIRTAKGQTEKLCKALKLAMINNTNSLPVVITGKPVSRSKIDINIINALTRQINADVNIDGINNKIKLPSMGEEKISYTLKNEIAFDEIKKISLPIDYIEEGSKFHIPSRVDMNVFAVTYVEEGAIVADASINDWEKIPAIKITNQKVRGWAASKGYKLAGGDNFSVSYKIAWNEKAMFFLVIVDDNEFVAEHKGSENNPSLWYNNDVVQLYFDSFNDGRAKFHRGISGNDENDFSYEFLPTSDKTALLYRRMAPDAQLTGGVYEGLKDNVVEKRAQVAFNYSGGKLIYEVKIPLACLQPINLEEGSTVGFAMTVLDRDKSMDRAFQDLSNTPIGTYPYLHPEVYPTMLLSK